MTINPHLPTRDVTKRLAGQAKSLSDELWKLVAELTDDCQNDADRDICDLLEEAASRARDSQALLRAIVYRLDKYPKRVETNAALLAILSPPRGQQ